MKFTVNRKIMLEHLKTMIRIIPKETPMQELKGFLVEANEDDGYLYLTATNLEVAMQRKLKPEVESGGSFVMNAKLLLDMMSVLGGDDVIFEEINPGTMRIKSGNCIYTMKVLDSGIYPRPKIPFPDSTVGICNIRQMFIKTNATVGSEGSTDSSKGIHFRIAENGFKLESCNLRDIAISTNKMSCGGSMNFMLPKQTVSYLASAAGDEELQVGMCGAFIVFLKAGMLFSARKLTADFVDINKILSSLERVYTAAVEGDVFEDAIKEICDVATMGSESSYVKLEFNETSITASTYNEVGSVTNSANCVTVNSKYGLSFYYPAADLKRLFKTVEGRMMLQLDWRGYLLVEDVNNKFMLTATPEQSVQKQIERIEERKKKPRARKKEQEEPKAA